MAKKTARVPNPALSQTVMDKTGETLAYLYGRWLDEGKYESFDAYEKAMAAKVNRIKGIKFIGMQKRPFGFRWMGSDGYHRLTTIDSRGNMKTLRFG